MKRCNLFLALLLLLSGNGLYSQPPADWLGEMEGVRTGKLTVPENHEEPGGKQISITYAVLQSDTTGEKGPPLVFFSGGPGGNSLVPGLIGYLKEHVFLQDRDIILFDQRGIGLSSPMPDMSFASFDILAQNADPSREFQLTRAMISDYKARCTRAGIRPRYYNSQQSARDVGLLFEHLGYKSYILFGGSYGTRLARMVQDLYPDKVAASVLDSPAPLSGDFLLNRLESYSLSLGRILANCQQQAACQERYPDLRNDYLAAIEKLRETPLHVTFRDSLDFWVNAQDGIYLLRRLLYQANAREKAPELIEELKGNGGPVLQQVLDFEYELTGELNMSMLLSVERFENFNPGNTGEELDEAYAAYPLIPVPLGFFDAFYRAGMEWHHALMPLSERKFSESAVPTLIFVNRYDPVTPPSNGYLFMEDLSEGHLLVLDEGGHGGGNKACKEEVIRAFMQDPRQLPDTSCLNLYRE
ncbi:alpha/beta hydrolase [Robiginitalea sp. SC105]|uniref:alpha/beta hydrolase n=1 Tax=Robiginitalea sp. SC105 TaxID=2762332 RepID=UPI00163AEF6E|nr:alpha/beta fold hydrolase [Robiginitalea sp. SC105]MBC2839806.1 alpha/beta fold hydrolase [Robiginitalea sp. SC105]